MVSRASSQMALLRNYSGAQGACLICREACLGQLPHHVSAQLCYSPSCGGKSRTSSDSLLLPGSPFHLLPGDFGAVGTRQAPSKSSLEVRPSAQGGGAGALMFQVDSSRGASAWWL